MPELTETTNFEMYCPRGCLTISFEVRDKSVEKFGAWQMREKPDCPVCYFPLLDPAVEQ